MKLAYIASSTSDRMRLEGGLLLKDEGAQLALQDAVTARGLCARTSASF